jgi:hypothetical protein
MVQANNVEHRSAWEKELYGSLHVWAMANADADLLDCRGGWEDMS